MPASPLDDRPLGFALCHGWGLDAACLQPLARALLAAFPAGSIRCEWFDLGFGGEPLHPKLDQDRFWIAVGHSYGFAWLMQQAAEANSHASEDATVKNETLLPAWGAAVAINGFTRFCRQPGRPEGTPMRLLDAMLARLAQDPVATVEDFRQRCGLVPDEPAFEAAWLANDTPQARNAQAALQQHLLALRTLDLPLSELPLLALATRDDAIVSLALARACFQPAAAAGRLTLQELAGDHLSLLRQPAMLAGQIRAWLHILDA